MPVLPAAIFGLPEWAERLVLAGVVLVVALVLLWLVGWIVPRLLARTRLGGGPRARLRKTAVSALAASLRYVILVAALVAMAFALAGGGGVAAVSGGALVVVIAGFASQRLLVDVIAGFFILFEDQYGVGDVVRLEPSGHTGRVRSVELRTTVLSGPGGERMTVPNGQITAVRLMPDGHRRHRLEFLTREPGAVTGAVHALVAATAPAGGPWTSAPRVVLNDCADGVTRVIVIVEVDALREDAVGWLAGAVSARAGDALEAPPLHGIDLGGR